MLAFFKKPYPYNSLSPKEIIASAGIGVFVAFFLTVFQPFGISNWETPSKLLKIAGFGLVSFVCTLVFKILLAGLLKNSRSEERWTVSHEVLALLGSLLFIASGNLAYAYAIYIISFGLAQFLMALLATCLLGLFPITANIAIKYNRYLALNQKEALQMKHEVLNYRQHQETVNPETESLPLKETSLLKLIAENDKDVLEIDPEDLVYIESADNYSKVVFLKKAVLTKSLIRASLKRIESQIEVPFIIRCHRSYIVNIKQIEQIKGNAQGYKIDFRFIAEVAIPVSRNYGKILLEALKSLK